MIALRQVGRLARHAVVFEINIYRSLLRWVLRHPSVPSGHEPFGYAQMVTPVLALWIFGSAIEIPLVHVLVPWEGPRVALLILGVWGLMWMFGLMAGLRTYPHLMAYSALRIRNGPTHDIAVQLASIERVTTGDRSLPSSMWALQPVLTDRGVHLHVAVSGQVNVHLTLQEPLGVATRKGHMTITALSFWADRPRELARQLCGSASPVKAGHDHERAS